MQALECGGIRDTFYLNKISAWMAVLGIKQPRLEHAVIGQQQQPLTVEVETSCGIHARRLNIIRQRSSPVPIGKLGQHPIRLVKANDTHMQSSVSCFVRLNICLARTSKRVF